MRHCVLKSRTEGVKLPLMWQTLSLQRFARILATLYTSANLPKKHCVWNNQKKRGRHVAYYGALHQHLRAILFVLGATGARRNTDFAMGFRYGSPGEILYSTTVILRQEPIKIRIWL